MAKGKQHLDEFLRGKLSSLPNAPVQGFEKLELRMAAKQHRGVLLLFLLPAIVGGIFWLSTFTEGDLAVQPNQTESVVQPETGQPLAEPTTPAEGTIAVEQNRPEILAKPRLARGTEKPITPSAQNNVASREAGNVTAEPEISEAQVNVVAAEPEQGTLPQKIGAQENAAEEKVVAISSVETQETVQISAPEEETEDFVLQPTEAQPEVAHTEMAAEAPIAIAPIWANTSRWSVHANFYPNYTFRELEVKPEYKNTVDSRYQAIVDESERGGFAFNAGLSVRYYLGNDLFISSGLGFIEMKVTGNYSYTIYDDVELTKNETGLVGKTENNGYQHATNVDEGIIQAYRYLQVPMHISYQPWASNKLRLIIEGGVSYIRFLNADGTTIDPITMVPHELSDLDYTQNLGSFDFKIGFAYFVSPQVSLGLEPSFMYFSNSIFTDENPLYVVPWSVGVNFNVALRLY